MLLLLFLFCIKYVYFKLLNINLIVKKEFEIWVSYERNNEIGRYNK